MIVDRDDWSEGDLLISVITKRQADDWGVDYPEGQFGPFGYWLQKYHGPRSFEPIAKFSSEEAAMDWALLSRDSVTVWLEE